MELKILPAPIPQRPASDFKILNEDFDPDLSIGETAPQPIQAL